ncbi:MAG: DNA mismatch repair protein MutS [Gemmatimonadaceae bacterium]
MTREATPLMQQYREIKKQHPDAVLFFRMGDFYEMFYDDAELASRVLGLTLTSRNNGGAAEVPLAGVPVKAGHDYLRRLVQQGYRVAICEQVEDPRLAKGVVKREVIETVTPGAAFSDELLESDRHNYLCALLEQGEVIGVAAADLSIGTFRLIVCGVKDAEDVVARLSPREILMPRTSADAQRDAVRLSNALVTEREPWEFDAALARDELLRRFRVAALDGLGITTAHDAAVGAAGALLRYLSELQPSGTPHLMRPTVESTASTMPLDEMTRRNLELLESLRGGEAHNERAERERSGTLLGVLDRTLTPMGARKLREWILAPLLDRDEIDARLDAVGALKDRADVQLAMSEALDGVRDIERLGARTAAGRATPRDLGGLRDSLARLPDVESALRQVDPAGLLATLAEAWDCCADLTHNIARHLVDRPPAAIGSGEAGAGGDTIRAGVDRDLDDLRALRDGGRDAIAQIQAAERARTSIASLKVGYNKVFGYYIEVTNANKHLIPPDYQRRQTLTGAERYVTPALKEYEERVLTATEQIEQRERELFERLRRSIGDQITRLQSVALQIAVLDVVLAFAAVASREGYVRPDVTDDFSLTIVGGRHPVVERMMAREAFIPNDVGLTPEARMVILTGPNMAGKSTILRQVGLIVLLAQIGSFVPATRATIGLVDRIFTRVGASDNLVRGQSTFMVEMAETSAILHAATNRSLVLLDEIGRGTSTYDGVSIAWAVSEHIHEKIGCKTIFATHYHELTQLAEELGALRNYNVAVREVGDEVLFLHRLQPGPADRSYGIEVGRLAGLPDAVIQRARAVLNSLEGDELVRRLTAAPSVRGMQLSLFTPATHPIVERLQALRTDELTPLAALQLLDELAGQART